MRKIGVVFIFIAAELFLQGCVPAIGRSILIRNKDQSALRADMKADILKVAELAGKQYGYTQESAGGEKVQLNMYYRKPEGFGSFINVYYEKDFVKICIGEIGTRTLSNRTTEVQNEIVEALNNQYSVSIK